MASRTALGRACLAVGVTLLAVGCGAESEVDSADVMVESGRPHEDPAVIGTIDWDHLVTFYGDADPDLNIAALYGRATGRTAALYWAPQHGYCSGGLVDDDLYATARHCRLVEGDDPISVHFGMYGDTAFDDARHRLVALGVPESVVAGLTDRFLGTWTCDLEFSTRWDLEYFRCRTKPVIWSEAGAITTFALNPGHLWGHFKATYEPFTVGVGTDLYLLSVAARCHEHEDAVLLSPVGELKDRLYHCVDEPVTYSAYCFEHNLDSVEGSSGGPLVVKATHSAFGVDQGVWWYTMGNPNDVCDPWDFGWSVGNSGSYFGTEILQLTGDAPLTLPTGSPHVDFSDWVGSTAGTRLEASCPTDYLAAGFVGTTLANGNVGNLGLICVPHQPSNQFDYPLDRATVIAGGSVDTGLASAVNVDFNTYLREYVSSEHPAPGEQHFLMCPQASYITQIGVFANQLVHRLAWMICQRPHSSAAFHRDFTHPFDIGTNEFGTYSEPGCGAGEFFSGIVINSGWYTDGFVPICREAL